MVATDADDLREKLDRAAAMIGRQPDAPFALPGGVFYDRGPADPGRVAFVFPGQGSQYTGMGGDIAMAFPAAQNVWDFAAGLERAGGRSATSCSRRLSSPMSSARRRNVG